MERFEGFERWLSPAQGRATRSPAPIDPSLMAPWLNALYESPVLFSGLLDAEGRVVAANRLSVEGCGFRRAETMGRPFWECGWWSPDPELASRIRHWCAESVASGKSLRAVCRYFRGDGSASMVELALDPIADPVIPGGPAGYVVATGLDISDLLTAQANREDEIAADAVASRSIGQRFRDALDAMIDNVAIVRSVRDADGSIVDFLIEFVNQTTLDRADASPARLMGGHLLQLFPAWRNSGLFRLFVRVVETGEPFVGERLTYSSALPEGVRRPGYWNVRVAKLDDGYIAAWRDVTSAVRAEESIHQAEALAERERMATEILQRAALPGKLPTVSGVALGAYHQPAVSAMPIGGDWYDVVVPTRGRIVLVIADVAGHGPAAAGFMLQLRNYLRTIATDVDQPDELLRRANRTAFTLHGRDSLLTTCCVVILEVERGELHWALAGHPPPLVRSGNGAARMLVSHPDPPLGMSSDTHYAGYTERVSVGDRLVLYTDGLVESRQSSIDEGIAALRRAVDASRDLDPQRASELLANQLSSRQDDVALIVVDVLGRR